MSERASLEAVVRGRVQGVFFRAFVARKAVELGLTGYVRNLSGGEAVEVVAEGNRGRLEHLLKHLRIGPPAAKVKTVEVRWTEYIGQFHDFEVRP